MGVRYLVEGSVRRSASRIRVTAQLIDAETGNHMWVERYDRELADVFEIQDEIAESVATVIGRTVGDAVRNNGEHCANSLEVGARATY